MTDSARHDAWQAGDAYDAYMGRWSRRMALPFLDWLAAPAGMDWLDVGCGTGALTGAIIVRQAPRRVVAIDPSAGFLEQARRNVPDERVAFRQGDAQALPVEEANSDFVVSGLVLNFVPDRVMALEQMKRAARPGGHVAFYVWDYAGGGVAFMRAFWDQAVALDPAAAELTESSRFGFCQQDSLAQCATEAGLVEVESRSITSTSRFADFDDYWRPFTLGAGPAPGYCACLDPEARDQLRQRLFNTLPRSADGPISMPLRAWAVRGKVGQS